LGFSAIAYFDDGKEYDVTQKAIWSAGGSSIGEIDQAGLLTIGQTDRLRDVLLQASFGYKDVELETYKTVVVLTDASRMTYSEWPTYQGNPQRTGFVPIALDPEEFAVRWEKTISSSKLNPVSAAAGRVFVGTTTELSCLDARDGEVLWSQSDWCQHQPTYAYGRVYLQVGRDQSYSGAPRSYLKAIAADTGEAVFASPFDQQGPGWYAPAVYDGSVYIGGGSYGGMYGFNAISGSRMWFRTLPQIANWTPAVEGRHSFAYLSGRLYAVDRHYGTQDYAIQAGFSASTSVPVIANNKALVISAGSLYCLDLHKKKVAWAVGGANSGMPAAAEGVVYAANGNILEARNDSTGELVWSWTCSDGNVKSPFIVTKSHVIVGASTRTHAVEILSGESEWSYPATGALSLGNDTLYIAGTNGRLTAIAAPDYVAAVPVKLEIEGPESILESSISQYRAVATYSDGSVRDRTAVCDWAVSEAPWCAFGSGPLSVGELLYPQETIVLTARYSQGGTTVIDEIKITVHIKGTVEQLVARNLEKAVQSKETILFELARAMRKEQAASSVADGLKHAKTRGGGTISRPELNKAVNQINRAITSERVAGGLIESSLENILYALRIFAPESPYAGSMAPYLAEADMLGAASSSDGDLYEFGDLNRDGVINTLDLAILAENWLRTGSD